MKKKLCLAFASFAVVGALVGAAFPASAWSVRQNSSFCMTDPGANVFHDGAGVSNNSTTVVGRLVCPVIDTSATPKTGILSLGVLVRDMSTTDAVRATACINFGGAFGGTCGATAATSVAGTGTFSLSPSRAAWTGANDTPYIVVQLPVKAATVSHLMGYSFSG
jgi:hypothetical protein